MRTAGVHFRHAAFHQGIGTKPDGTGCIDDISDQNGCLALNVTDDVHDFTDIRLRTAFVDNRQRCIHEISQLSCLHNAAMVMRHDHRVLNLLGATILG
ncbi:hypothetical protein AML91_00065 [Paenibacillus jilunlii]|uniref:Uncharacterized protein n=1 Tax=Paenibacillus jilunlii TaxID=682956 RepID=A0ABR5T5T0_9BACL|nr:hypothetical protein AML91_00065 [Paenibacillus jilunlii]